MLVPPPSLLVLLHLLKVDKLKTMPLLRILVLDLELLALMLLPYVGDGYYASYAARYSTRNTYKSNNTHRNISKCRRYSRNTRKCGNIASTGKYCTLIGTIDTGTSLLGTLVRG